MVGSVFTAPATIAINIVEDSSNINDDQFKKRKSNKNNSLGENDLEMGNGNKKSWFVRKSSKKPDENIQIELSENEKSKSRENIGETKSNSFSRNKSTDSATPFFDNLMRKTSTIESRNNSNEN